MWFVIAQRAQNYHNHFSDQNGQLSVPNVIFDAELGRGREELIMNWDLYRSQKLPYNHEI